MTPDWFKEFHFRHPLRYFHWILLRRRQNCQRSQNFQSFIHHEKFVLEQRTVLGQDGSTVGFLCWPTSKNFPLLTQSYEPYDRFPVNIRYKVCCVTHAHSLFSIGNVDTAA